MKRLKSFIFLGVLLIVGGIIWGMAGFNQHESTVVKPGEYFRSAGRICERTGTHSVLALMEDYIEIYEKLFPHAQEVILHPADHCTHASSFTWKDAEQELLIRYGDSGSWTIPMSGLIRRDYQPAGE